MLKLSPTMEKALENLTGNYESAYRIGADLSTLNALVRRGLAERKRELGYMFFPRINTKYRKK